MSGDKTTILKALYGDPAGSSWNHKLPIISQIQDPETRLCGVGLSSIPDWFKPYNALSNGQQHRAHIAQTIGHGAVVDEFTSVVDRTVAKALAHSCNRMIKKQGLKRIVFASCHFDIIEYLQPDWVYNTDTKTLARGCLSRPRISINVYQTTTKETWPLFRRHHYLDDGILAGATCWAACIGDICIAMASSIAMPCGSLKNAWREHRTVVLPEFQGFGIGPRLSDAVAEWNIQQGRRYFSKTSHPRMGEYRESSPKWKPTTKNRRKRSDYLKSKTTKQTKSQAMKHFNRECFSHEYIGGQSNE